MIGMTFTFLIVLSVIAVYFAFRSKKSSIDENKRYISIRAWGLVILSAGFIVHTLGDFLSSRYGAIVELSLESLAHVIIMISFVFFIVSAHQILISAKGYSFK